MAKKKSNITTYESNNNSISKDNNEDTAVKKRNGINNHHGGAAGDGQPLVKVDENGKLHKYDKYGNLVTENTGKGKGIMLKNYYACANKNISAPMPEDIVKNLTRPYFSINDMPLEYIYNSIMNYFISLTEPVYERVPKLDENDNPMDDSNGKPIFETKLVKCNYKNVPTLYGLAQALGVEKATLYDYLNTKQFTNNQVFDTSNTNTYSNGYSNHKQTTLPNSRNKLVDLNDSNIYNTILYKIYGDSIFEERNRMRTEKDYKIDLLKRARQEILKYHEQRLGTNENVSGSMFALLNSNDGWSNEHKVTLEIPDLLGKVKTPEELDRLADDDDNIIVVDNGEGVFEVPKDLD